MPNDLALARAQAAYQGVLPSDAVWIDQAGPESIYVPKNILDFDGMTMQDYLANYKGRIKFAKDVKRFDTKRVTAGAATVKGKYSFFTVQQGQPATTIDTGATAYTKDEMDTNMLQAGQMEKGTALLVDHIEIEVPLTHREFGSLTVAQPVTFAISGTDTLGASNTLVGLQRCARFEFNKKRENLWEGRFFDAPPEGGISGVLGGATAEGVLQNGFGFCKRLREVVVLAENYLFEFDMFLDVDIAAWPYATEIKVNLCGLEIGSVGGI